MSNLLIDQANEIKKRARQRAGAEMKNNRVINWHGNTAAQQSALRLAKLTLALTNRLVDEELASLKHQNIDSASRHALIQAKLESIDLIIDYKSPERRIAFIQAQQANARIIDEQISKTDTLSPAEVSARIEELIGDADAARTILKELKHKPKVYYRIANAFISGGFARSTPGIIKDRLTPGVRARRLVDYLKKQKIKHHKALEKATKWFGLSLMGLTITTVVFETLAEENKWAQHFAKATLAAGTGVVLGAVVTGSALTSVITATLVAAGSTAEVPPVAAALLAAGIVIVGTIAIAALFDSLIDLIFGISEISPSMRLSMSTQMHSNMSSSMSSSMVASMVSIPK